MKQIIKKFLVLIIFFVMLILYLNEIKAADFSKTVKFFIIQQSGIITDGTEVSQPFTMSIAEDNPQITSAFIEIKGSAKSPALTTGIINVKLNSNPYSLYNLNVSTKPQKFTINHDITSFVSADFPGVPGSKNYTLYIRNDNFETTDLSAKLILTYKYTKNTGNLPVSGYAISSIMDTESVNGSAFNSMMWKGSLNGGKVRLQLATSNSEFGPWTFIGPDCTPITNYETNPNTPIEIQCFNEHNNKRYFRYKITLCSNNCVGNGLNNPTVTDVIVNWSP
ncbi:MAG: hypothetical protein P1P85_02005 [Patescibacteria group bacterium]|nr:hypothetical protein [Patescibacteria group bacterium]